MWCTPGLNNRSYFFFCHNSPTTHYPQIWLCILIMFNLISHGCKFCVMKQYNGLLNLNIIFASKNLIVTCNYITKLLYGLLKGNKHKSSKSQMGEKHDILYIKVPLICVCCLTTAYVSWCELATLASKETRIINKQTKKFSVILDVNTKIKTGYEFLHVSTG